MSRLQRLILPVGVPTALVLLAAYALSGIFMSGYPRGFDFLAHLVKVESLNGSVNFYAADWYDGWYGGYYQFTQYPFLSYLPAAIIDGIVNSSLFAIKIEVFAAALISVIGMYFACRELLKSTSGNGPNEIAAAAGGVTFGLSPALLSVLFGRGELPDYVGMAIAPVTLLLLFRALQTKNLNWWVAVGVSLAISLLIHPNVAIYVVGTIVIYAILSAPISRDMLTGMGLALVVMLGLSAFWLLPYLFVERETGFLSAREGASLHIALTSLFEREATKGPTWYFGLLPTGLALAGLVIPSVRKISLPFLAMAAVGLVIASGWAAPIHNNLPIFHAVDADNAMLLVHLGTGFMVALATRSFLSFNYLPRIFSYLVGIFLVALVFIDLSIGMTYAKSDYQIPIEFDSVASYMVEREAAPLERTALIRDAGQEPLAALFPVLSGHPITSGYEYQSSANSALSYAVRYDLLPSGQMDKALYILNLFNVRYVIVDNHTRSTSLDNLLSSGQFRLLVESSRWVVLERTQQLPPIKFYDEAGGFRPINSKVTDYEPRHVIFQTATEKDLAVVIPISWSPGWQVNVDGASVTTVNDNGFVSFVLPSGEHEIVMSLETLGITNLSLLVSGAFLLLLTIFLAVRTLLATRRASQSGSSPTEQNFS